MAQRIRPENIGDLINHKQFDHMSHVSYSQSHFENLQDDFESLTSMKSEEFAKTTQVTAGAKTEILIGFTLDILLMTPPPPL